MTTSDESLYSGINPLPAVQDILHQLSTAILVLDRDLRIRRWNRRAESLFQRKKIDAKGKRYDDVVPAFRAMGLEVPFREAMVERRTIRLFEVPVDLDRAMQGETDGVPKPHTDTRFVSPGHALDGRRLSYLDIVIDPLFDVAGGRIGVAITFRDATEQAVLRVNLRQKTELLEIIFRVSNALHATSRLDATLFVISSVMVAKAFGNFDRAAVFLVDESSNRLRGQMGMGPLGTHDLQTLWDRVAEPQSNLPEVLADAAPDVWAQMQALSETVSNMDCPLDAFPSFADAAGGRAVWRDRDFPESNLFAAQLREGLQMRHFVAVSLVAQSHPVGVLVLDLGHDGRALTPEWQTFLQMYGNHAALAIDNARAYENIVRQAQTDSLTGLFNHGHFQVSLARMVKQAERYRYPVSLVMLDIDYFKRLNDTYGHPAGDHVLRRLAALLTKSVRESDLCARYGGEEFVIVMPHTPLDDAEVMAERLRQKVEAETLLAINADRIPVTISLGVSEFPTFSRSPETLISTADSALYLSKHAGRNRTSRYLTNSPV